MFYQLPLIQRLVWLLVLGKTSGAEVLPAIRLIGSATLGNMMGMYNRSHFADSRGEKKAGGRLLSVDSLTWVCYKLCCPTLLFCNNV